MSKCYIVGNHMPRLINKFSGDNLVLLSEYFTRDTSYLTCPTSLFLVHSSTVLLILVLNTRDDKHLRKKSG